MVEQIDMRQIETIVRHIFPSTSPVVERVAEGISTRVYRITARGEIFYLCVLPEEGANFAPEVATHTQLRQRQVSVPEVIYFEHYNDLLQRSIMITTEIKGQPVSQSASLPEESREAILAEAGQDLACINSVPAFTSLYIYRHLTQYIATCS